MSPWAASIETPLRSLPRQCHNNEAFHLETRYVRRRVPFDMSSAEDACVSARTSRFPIWKGGHRSEREPLQVGCDDVTSLMLGDRLQGAASFGLFHPRGLIMVTPSTPARRTGRGVTSDLRLLAARDHDFRKAITTQSAVRQRGLVRPPRSGVLSQGFRVCLPIYGCGVLEPALEPAPGGPPPPSPLARQIPDRKGVPLGAKKFWRVWECTSLFCNGSRTPSRSPLVQ
jgi:hypothetical protein